MYGLAKRFVWLVPVLLLLMPSVQALERISEKTPKVFTDLKYDLAIYGYDPVSYFTESKAVPGSEEFAYEWKGAKWLFSSAENRDTFAAEPEKYAPQYGGWCAYAMSQGVALSIDPESWTVYEGKLYLNDPSAYERWLKNVPQYIEKGDKNWHDLVVAPKQSEK